MGLFRSGRLRAHLGRGAITSLLLHAGAIFPLIVAAFLWGDAEQVQRESEVEVSFQDANPETLPEDLPPIEKPQDIEKSQPEPDPAKKKTTRNRVSPKVAASAAEPDPKITPPTPAERKALPPVEEPPEEPKPQPPTPPKLNQKVVDLDNDKDEEAPPDAKYLAQKNNSAKEETRATDTNLERESKGTAKASSPSDNQDPNIGGKEDQIAQLEEQKSRLGRSAPAQRPSEKPELSGGEPQAKPLLSMRDLVARPHEISPETVDRSLPRDPEGARALPHDDLESMKDMPGRGGPSQRTRLRLSGEQMRSLFGDDTDAAERLAKSKKSEKKGRFAERHARLQSALENFIPEVKPGNQTALNTRAAPFAAFIARMHRHIHELWGFGFLEDLESKPPTSPYNQRHLVTQLEIVMNADGTLDNVKVIRPSGFTPYDVAAVDTVYSAGPFPDPPRAIRSANGKIYVHWRFHRDEHQCATSGADYFILNNAPSGGDRAGGPLAEGLPGDLRPAPAPNGARRLERRLDDDTPERRAKRQEMDRAAGIAEPDAESARKVAREFVRPDDPGARETADRFFAAFVKGDVLGMIQTSGFPFRSTSGIVGQSAADLQRLFKDLVGESAGPRRSVSLQLYSAAGLRGALGSVPPGFDEGTGMIFAVARAGGEILVLALERQQGSFRATGMFRP